MRMPLLEEVHSVQLTVRGNPEKCFNLRMGIAILYYFSRKRRVDRGGGRRYKKNEERFG